MAIKRTIETELRIASGRTITVRACDDSTELKVVEDAHWMHAERPEQVVEVDLNKVEDLESLIELLTEARKLRPFQGGGEAKR